MYSNHDKFVEFLKEKNLGIRDGQDITKFEDNGPYAATNDDIEVNTGINFPGQ